MVFEEGEEGKVPRKIILPYAFYTDALDLTVGAAFGTSGVFQPQTKIFLTGFVTTNESRILFLSLFDYQVPFAQRVFINFLGSFAYYTDQREYTGFNAGFPGEHAGSNDSSEDNYLRGEGDDSWYDLEFRYLLPIGHGRHTLINSYILRNGLLVNGQTGGDTWNPIISGRTNLQLSFFDRHRTIINESGVDVGDSNGAIISMEYDNRDFLFNPGKGSLQKIIYKKDFGIESSGDWSVVQLDLRKYYLTGHTDKLRQSVLALNLWTSYTPSWKLKTDNNNPAIEGQPPNVMGSSLGGFYRLRSYPVERFSDKAAIYYSAEYRLMLDWSPWKNSKLLKPLDIDWWMLVPFVELGRVAPHWSVSDLHQDMRSVLGVGLRLMAQKAVFRLDTGFSSDAWSMYAMVGHPF